MRDASKTTIHSPKANSVQLFRLMTNLLLKKSWKLRTKMELCDLIWKWSCMGLKLCFMNESVELNVHFAVRFKWLWSDSNDWNFHSLLCSFFRIQIQIQIQSFWTFTIVQKPNHRRKDPVDSSIKPVLLWGNDSVYYGSFACFTVWCSLSDLKLQKLCVWLGTIGRLNLFSSSRSITSFFRMYLRDVHFWHVLHWRLSSTASYVSCCFLIRIILVAVWNCLLKTVSLNYDLPGPCNDILKCAWNVLFWICFVLPDPTSCYLHLMEFLSVPGFLFGGVHWLCWRSLLSMTYDFDD